VNITMHGPKPGQYQEHEFRTSAKVVSPKQECLHLFFFESICQATLENTLLTDVYESVQSHYYKGRPLHHLDSASDPHLNDASDRATRSSIFVIPYPVFDTMDNRKLQQIFRDRHILVTDVPHDQQQFCEERLAALGGYEQIRNIHGAFDCVFWRPMLTSAIDISTRTAAASHRCGRGGTLQEFWVESQKAENGRILNVLDIPMGMRDGIHMPGYK
jgi:hypothetical protein